MDLLFFLDMASTIDLYRQPYIWFGWNPKIKVSDDS